MVDVTLGIITRLKANTTICSSSYVGATPNQRVYRATLPAGAVTYPCIVVTKIDTKRLNFAHNRVPVAQSRVQVTTFAAKDVDADTIAELIADDLHGLHDTHVGSGLYVIRVDDAGGRIDASPEYNAFLNHRDFLIQHYY